MAPSNTTLQNPQSEKEASKQASRYSSLYWARRLFRPTYTKNSKRFEVAEWYVQLQHGGRREINDCCQLLDRFG